MNDDEPVAETWLRRAREGLGPSPDDAVRVRRAVAVAVSVGTTAALTEHAGAEGPNASAVSTLSRWAKLGLAASVAAATGVGGYALGFRAGVEQQKTAAVVPVAPRQTSHLEHDVPERAVPILASPEVPPSARALRAAPAALAVTAPNPASSGASPETPLAVETRLLGRVDRALRDDNPRFALGLLGELDRQVPGGELAQERQAARVIAHCLLGSESAQELAAKFKAQHAASAYRARIDQACSSDAGKRDSDE